MSNPQDITNSVKAANHLAGKIYAAQAYADSLDYIFRRYKDSVTSIPSSTSSSSISSTSPKSAGDDPVLSSTLVTILQQILLLNHDPDMDNRLASAQAIQAVIQTIIHHTDTDTTATSSTSNNSGSSRQAWTDYYQAYFLYPHTDGLLTIDKYDMKKVIEKVVPLTAQGPTYWSNLSIMMNPVLHHAFSSVSIESTTGRNRNDPTIDDTMDEVLKKRLIAQRSDILRVIGIEATTDNSDNVSSNNNSVVVTALKVTDLRSIITDNDLDITNATTTSTTSTNAKESTTTIIPLPSTTFASLSSMTDTNNNLSPSTLLSLPTPIECLQSLYGDICFNLFSPVWEIRHGSAVFLQGILQGIEKVSSTSPPSISLSTLCRYGLEDILLRCITILAIDHFTDYSSLILTAPVREIIGQILAMLARYWIIHNLPFDRLGVSLLTLTNNKEWHTRHGCGLGIRAITLSILNYYSDSNDSLPNRQNDPSNLPLSIDNPPSTAIIIPSSIQTNLFTSFMATGVTLLQDTNSDVTQIAGDILYLLSFTYTRTTDRHALVPCIPTQEYGRLLHICIQRLLTELQSVEANSTSVLPVALLPLISRLIFLVFDNQEDATTSTTTTIRNDALPVDLIPSMVIITSVYIEHPFLKVRKSALGALYILTKLIQQLFINESTTRTVITTKNNRSKGKQTGKNADAGTITSDPYDLFRTWFISHGHLYILSSIVRVIMVDISFDTLLHRTENSPTNNCTETSVTLLQYIEQVLFPFPERNNADTTTITMDNIATMGIIPLGYRILYELFTGFYYMKNGTTSSSLPTPDTQRMHNWLVTSLTVLGIPDNDAIPLTNFRPVNAVDNQDTILDIEDDIRVDNTTFAAASTFSKSTSRKDKNRSVLSSSSTSPIPSPIPSFSTATWNLSIDFPSTLNIPMNFLRRVHGCGILGIACARIPWFASLDPLTIIKSLDPLHSSFIQQVVSLFVGFTTAYRPHPHSIIRTMQMNQRTASSTNFYYSINNEKDERPEKAILLQELLPSLRELSTACGNLQAALGYWKNLLASQHNYGSVTNTALLPKETVTTKRSRTTNVRIEKERETNHENDANVVALLDFHHAIHTTNSLIIDTKNTTTEYKATLTSSSSSSSTGTRVTAYYEEVELQLNRTEGLYTNVLRNNLRYKLNGAISIASQSILPFIYAIYHHGTLDATLLPDKLTPTVRTLLYTLSTPVSTEVGNDPVMNAFVITLLSHFIRCTMEPLVDDNSKAHALSSSSSSSSTNLSSRSTTDNLSMIGSRILTKLLDTVATYYEDTPSKRIDQNIMQYKYTMLFLNLFRQHNHLRANTDRRGTTADDDNNGSLFSSLLFSVLPSLPLSSMGSSPVNYSDGQLIALAGYICTSTNKNSSDNDNVHVEKYLTSVYNSLCSSVTLPLTDTHNVDSSAVSLVPSLSYTESSSSHPYLSPVHQQLFTTAVQFSFEEWIRFYGNTLYPILTSPTSSSTLVSQIMAFEILYTCLNRPSLPILSSLGTTPVTASQTKSSTIREGLLIYGPIFIAIVLKYFVHPHSSLRTYSSELFRILIQNLPVQVLATRSSYHSRLWINPPSHWIPSLRTIYTEGLSVARTLAMNASQSLSRMSPSIVRNIASMDTTVPFTPVVTEEVSTMSSEETVTIPFTVPLLALPSVTLRQYQIEGIAWLYFLCKHYLGGILADDMGLGKTIQILTMVACSILDDEAKANESITKRKRNNHPLDVPKLTTKKGVSLVICPASLMHFWAKEVMKFYPVPTSPTPSFASSFFRVLVYEGSISQRNHILQQVTMDHDNRHTLLITSYNILRNSIDTLVDKLPSDLTFCIFDEAHIVHNPNSELFKACSSLSFRCAFRFLLTGTPIQNSPNDIWSLFHLCLPGYLGDYPTFYRTLTVPVLKARNRTANDNDIRLAEEALAKLHKQILPFLLRRLKGDVLHELPPKILQDITLTLTPKQYELYRAFEQGTYGQALMHYTETTDNREDSTPSRTSSNSFRAITILRQICNHPQLLDPVIHDELTTNKVKRSVLEGNPTLTGKYGIDDSCKLLALKDLLTDLGFSGPTNDFSPPTTTTANTKSFLNEGITTGTRTKRSRQDKVDATNVSSSSSSTSKSTPFTVPLTNTTTTVPPTDHKVLIFSQTTKMLDVITYGLFRTFFPSLRYARIDGQTIPLQRVEIAHQFNYEASLQVLLLTTAVGGLGLSLIGADTIIFIDHDWNPVRDAQAMDRAHRIGQTRTVNIYRFITADTLEERIMSLQNMKERMANLVVGSRASLSSSSHTTEETMDTTEGTILSLFVDAAAKNAVGRNSTKKQTKTVIRSSVDTEAMDETKNPSTKGTEDDSEEDYDQVDLAAFMNVLRGNQ